MIYRASLVFLSTFSPVERSQGAVYRCELRIRVSPEVHETYSTSQPYASTRLAKDAVAQLALQEGVVILFKLHNSMTTQICKQLGIPIPATLEDHDTFEEENTTGVISQLVQQVTRDTDAISTTYSEVHSENGKSSGNVAFSSKSDPENLVPGSQAISMAQKYPSE